MSRMAATSGSDASLRIGIFLSFGLAAVVTVVGIVFGRVNPIVLPVSLLLLPALVAVALWTFARESRSFTPMIVAIAVALIDLGLGRAQGIALGLKGVAYLLAFIAAASQAHPVVRRLNTGEVLVLLFALWAWGSAIYSVDWWVSAYTGFGLMALVLIFVPVAFMSRDALQRQLTWVARGLGALVMLSAAFSVAFPHLALATEVAGAGRYSGLLGSPNSAGGVAGLALTLNLAWLVWPPSAASRAGRWQAALWILAALTMLALSGSRNAMLSTLLTCGVVFAIRLPRTAAVVAVVIAAAGLVLTIAGAWPRVVDAVFDLLSRQRHGFDVRNLTGRTEIWAFVLGKWQESPWIGYGLGGSRTVISSGFANFWGKSTGTAHNALLECLLDLGLVGSVLLFSYVAWVAAGAVRLVRLGRQGSLLQNLALPTVAYVLLFGLVEKSFAGTPSTATGGLLLAGALVGAMRRFDRIDERPGFRR